MNERIKELAYEAEDYADSIVDQGGEFHSAYTRKFAELIVRECMHLVKDCYSEGSQYLTVCASTIIEEHFGVEE